MSSSYAVNVAELPSRHPDLEITGAVPVVRRAILAKHEPALNKRQTRHAGSIMKRRWKAGWRGEYIARMAQIADVPADELIIPENEKVRYRFDGETPMVDLPRIRTAAGCAYHFDQRNCCALCVDEFSSKVWSRIGPPEGDAGYRLDGVHDATRRYRQHAIKAAEWFYEQFFELTSQAFEGTERTRDTALLEVTTVGLRVDGDITDAVNDAWLFEDGSANLDNDELCDYLAAAAGVDCDIRELLRKEKQAYWLTVPAVVRARSGVLASRKVLYLSRITGNLMQFIGVGLDDSASGDLANDVALKISRLIAGWV